MRGDSGGRTVALLGHYGTANLGDEAIIQAARQTIARRFPDVTVVGISGNPGDTRARHGIAAFPVRRYLDTDAAPAAPAAAQDRDTSPRAPLQGRESLPRRLIKAIPLVAPLMRLARGLVVFFASTLPAEMAFILRSYRFLRGVDLVMITGSGQLIDDWGGPWAFPYTLFRWALLSRLAGARFAAVSTGAGPIDSALGRLFYRMCLSLCDYRSVRDERSREIVRLIGFRGACHVRPDLAHGLGEPATRPVAGSKPVVAINPMPILDDRYWHTAEPEKTARYRDALTTFTTTLLREGYPVFIYKTHPTDQFVIDDILDSMDAADRERVLSEGLVRTNDTVEELMANIASADIVVATRFHGVLIPYALCVPAVGVYHHHKTVELMEQMGQAAYAVNFHDMTVEDLFDSFKRLEANLDAEKNRLSEIGERQRRALDEQYDQLLALLGQRPSRDVSPETVSRSRAMEPTGE